MQKWPVIKKTISNRANNLCTVYLWTRR